MDVDGFLRQFAPHDVREAIKWLVANGYVLQSHRGESTFGASFVYLGAAEVVITVDRSQWHLDIAPRPGLKSWQYDLLIAARSGRQYGEVFPRTGSRSPGEPLPDQLPEGVSWSKTLPEVLTWLDAEGVPAAVERAQRERFQLMWPSV